MNVPYEKVYTEQGLLVNPIINKEYLSPYKNRRERRKDLRPTRFRGNNKGYSIVATQQTAYFRRAQKITLPSGKVKVIEHYKLKGK